MKIKNINKKYGENNILKNINLNFDKNGIVFVLGSSGSGKSTLLNTLGLLDDDYEGDIYYNDEEPVKAETQRTIMRKKHIAFIFQECNLINSLSVRENIETAVDISEASLDKNEYKKIIEMFNLNEIEDRNVSNLSGGEKQRVAIARALVRNNEIIYADEPTGNLDEENSKIIFETLKNVSEDHLVIVVSHNKEAAEKYADRIIIIRDGVIFKDIDKGYSEKSKLILDDNRERYSKSDKWIKKISFWSFRMRKKKLIASMISILISLLCVGMVCGIFSAINNILEKANTDIIEADKIEINAVVSENQVNTYTSFSKDDRRKVEALPNIKEYIETIDFNPLVRENNGDGTGAYTEIIEINDFFKNRIALKCGRMIENDNEVIINDYAAKALFGDEESALGKSLEFIDFEKKPTVVGIKKDIGNNEQYIITLSNKLKKEITKSYFNSDDYTGVTIMPNYSEDNEYLSASTAYFKGVDTNFLPKIIYGKAPKSKNEALLDVNSFNIILTILGYDSELQAKQDIIDGKVDEKIINKIINRSYSANFGWNAKMKDIEIVGICESNIKDDDSINVIVYVDEKEKEAWAENTVNKIIIYINDYSSEAINDIKKFCKENNYGMLYEAEGTKDMFSSIFTVIALGIGVVAFIIIIISCILVGFSTKSNISDRIYEIGVLKSLGAERKSIFKIFNIENLIMGIAVSIAAILIFIILSLCGLSSWLSISGISFYNFEWWHIFAIILVGLFITMVSGLGKINKASKMSVTDAIRTKNI